MDKDINKIFREIKKIDISDNRRYEIRTFLENDIAVSNQRRFGLLTFLQYKKTFLAISIVFLFSFSGIIFAAENSLPGDFLYPIKINGIEKAVGLTKISKDAKENWEEKKEERRVEEIKKLKEQTISTESSKNLELNQAENNLVEGSDDVGDNVESAENYKNNEFENEEYVENYKEGEIDESYRSEEIETVEKLIENDKDIKYNESEGLDNNNAKEEFEEKGVTIEEEKLDEENDKEVKGVEIQDELDEEDELEEV